MSEDKKCWFCWSKNYEAPGIDYRNPTVNIGPQTWFEAKTVVDGFIVPMCGSCQKEYRIAILNLSKMLRARRSEFVK